MPSALTTLFDTLLGASDISSLIDADHVLCVFLFFPFVFMNSFIILSMFLAVIGIAFDDVRDEVIEAKAERQDEGIAESETPFMLDILYCYDVVVHRILRLPKSEARVEAAAEDDEEEEEDDAALRARCKELHLEFSRRVVALRDHQDALRDAVERQQGAR